MSSLLLKIGTCLSYLFVELSRIHTTRDQSVSLVERPRDASVLFLQRILVC
ncbi:Uncharacterised protein [Mycobacteroides abscessus subsp. abscessus]|nr:Uncharacterised protein [Mycobacteroides abscessus subsp. abscessus]